MSLESKNLSFSERNGFVTKQEIFQIKSMNKILRTELWNAYYIFISQPIEKSDGYIKEQNKWINKISWLHYFKKPFDEFPDYDSQYKNFIKNYIEKETWYKIYEFFEFTFRNIQDEDNIFKFDNFVEYINNKLKDNSSGYILQNNLFIPITNEEELEEINLLRNNVSLY